MTAPTVTPPTETPATPAPARSRWQVLDLRRRGRRALWWVGVYLGAIVIFGAFVTTRGADPVEMYQAMWAATVTSSYGFGQVLNRAAPFILAALAVAVPARAGLVNIGGEGQLVLGATAAGGMALLLADGLTGPPALVLMALAGAAAGAAWAGIAAVLRLYAGVSEAISTLLLNFVGANVLAFLVFGPWQDAAGNGQPASRPLTPDSFLPQLPFLPAHAGILVALAVAGAVAWALARTRWGFALRAVGGNPEAARRAGLSVGPLLLGALLIGGALAGLAGMIQFSGAEGQLRPGLAAGFGYTGFLASWLGRHHTGKVILAATLLACIVIAGNALQITSGLPGGAVNILTALLLVAFLARRPTRPEAGR